MELQTNFLKERFEGLETGELLSTHANGTLTDSAYTILEGELSKRGIAIPARPISIEDRDEQPTGFFRVYWNGDKPLSLAWAVIGFVGIIIVLCFALLAGVLITDQLPKTDGNFKIFIAIVLVIFTPYLVFASVTVWRCAGKSSSTVWAVLARIWVGLCILKYLSVVTGYA
jgi:hypothetical protein